VKVDHEKYGVPDVYPEEYEREPKAKSLNEGAESRNFFRMAMYRHPELRGALFHVSNEFMAATSNRGAAAGAGRRRKEMGVTAGVSDYIVLRPRGGFNFAVIEMKRRTPKHKPDDAQVEWLKERRDDGGFVALLTVLMRLYMHLSAILITKHYNQNLQGVLI